MEMPRLDEGATELDFEILMEAWNVYKLSDGTILRARPIVFKVLRSRQMTVDMRPLIGFAATTVLSAKVPENLMKTDAMEKEPAAIEKTIRLEFETVKEVWNEFKVEDGITLRVKLVPSRIVRLSRYNAFGEPTYIVTSLNVADVQVPESGSEISEEKGE